MKVMSPEYPHDRNVMTAHNMVKRPHGIGAWRAAAAEFGVDGCASKASRHTYTTAAMSRPGTITAAVASSPNRATNQAAIAGPTANPRFPPAEKNDIPSPRCGPEASVTAMDAIG